MKLDVGTVVMFNFTQQALLRILPPVLSDSLRSPTVSEDFRANIVHQAGVLAMGRIRSALGITSSISGICAGKIATGNDPSLTISYRITHVSGRKAGDDSVSVQDRTSVEVTQEDIAKVLKGIPGLSISLEDSCDIRGPAVSTSLGPIKEFRPNVGPKPENNKSLTTGPETGNPG